jgi:hypothetical protein
MKNYKNILFGLIVLVNSYISHSQQTDTKQCPCCTEAHQAFDFWVGEWTVYDTSGNIVGTNSIQKDYDNCVLREQWKSSKNSRGTSYNYYNLTDKTWNQVWIDNSGFSLTLKGNYYDNKMILKSALLDGKKGKYYNQITWKKNPDKSVTQTWSIFDINGELVQEAFNGIYKKNVK